jgi:hypothetical protein
MKTTTTLTARDRVRYLKHALKAADWFVNTQMRPARRENTDLGRFLYYYFMPEKRPLPGINWTMGRALFVLADAYKITRDKRYLESAELGARYLFAMQPVDPYYAKTCGTFREYLPQGNWGGILDGAQAASGLLMLYHATRNPDYLRRGRAFGDFLLRTCRRDVGFPQGVEYYPDRVIHPKSALEKCCIAECSAIPLWHLYNITRERKYLPPIVAAADRILPFQRDDGAMLAYRGVKRFDKLNPNQHCGRGEGGERLVLRNDDGIVVVMLAAYKITGHRKYLDAMVHYADWIVANEPHERPFCGFGIQAANVLDIGKVAGKDYTPWVVENVAKHCLSLQISGTGDTKADGGFCGEDEEDEGGIYGGKSKDYIPTRTTCYQAAALFRLSGRGTGTGFSVFGYGK